MPTLKFANILLEQNERSMSYPSLYCKSTEPVIYNKIEQAWTLSEQGSFDFTTYFNSLSIEKLKRYTTAQAFRLHLELKGSGATIIQTYADAFASHPICIEESKASIAPSDDYVQYDLTIQAPDCAVLAGFKIETEGPVTLGNCYYLIDHDAPQRDIEFVLATTTFKKENFIKHNIALVEKTILSFDDDISNHFNMYIIDNGRTLNVDELASDRIHIYPNNNVGGAGGFTYGMILAMEQNPKATHILLMDDDVAVSTESIKRTYNLLKILNDEYRDAFISGAMLNYEAGDEQWEDTGYMTAKGAFAPAKPNLRLTRFEDLVYNETYWASKEIRESGQRYAAWWYCCIPIHTIESNGLPLPVFVRCDDAEYGVRCKPHFITMNGLGIWHMSFHVRYNAAVERYQTTRNTLIAQNTTGFAPHSDFMAELHNNIRLELKKFGYENAELCLDAFEDFMKGPDFYSAPGIAEKTFMDANRNKETLIPFDRLEEEAHRLGLSDFDVRSIDRQLVDSDKPRTILQRVSDFVTDNNQRHFVSDGNGYAVIPVLGWAYPAGVIRGKKYLIVIDWYNRMGAIRTRDNNRYDAIKKRYKADLKHYERIKDDLREQYSQSRKKVTGLEFWKSYLNIQD